jgi:hypothetical protein
MMARRNPNRAPIKPVVNTMPILLGMLSPPANKKPAYATAGVQKVIRRYIANHPVRVIVSQTHPGTTRIFARERFGEIRYRAWSQSD